MIILNIMKKVVTIEFVYITSEGILYLKKIKECNDARNSSSQNKIIVKQSKKIYIYFQQIK